MDSKRLRRVPRVGETEFAGSALHQIEQLLSVLRSCQIDSHSGVVATEATDEAGHRIGCQSGQAAHAEGARHNTGDGGDCGSARLDVTKSLTGRPQECGSGSGQPHSTANPCEQRRTEFALEFLDGEREGRLRDEHGLGRCRESAVVDNGRRSDAGGSYPFA